MSRLSKSDKWYLMETAMLECSIAENVELGSLFIVEPKGKYKGYYYIVNREQYAAYKKNPCKGVASVKVYFKKHENSF